MDWINKQTMWMWLQTVAKKVGVPWKSMTVQLNCTEISSDCQIIYYYIPSGRKKPLQ